MIPLPYTDELQFLAQIIGIDEDKLCKPYRPFPSGRISRECGEFLYLLAVAICIAISVYNGLTTVSLVYMLAIWLYNEAGLSMYPLPKNVLGAVGYMCYSWGTTYIIGKSFVLPPSNWYYLLTRLCCIQAITSL